MRQVALLGVMGTMDDPERLRNLRQGLLRADAEVSAFFASARDLVCELDANGVFVRLNPRWQDQLGYALEEMQSRPWTEFVHPDDLGATRDALAKLKTEDTVRFENRLRHSNGSYRNLSWTATRWQTTGVILAVASDVTQRRDDERALHEIERFEKQVAEGAHEGIMVLDRDLKFLVWNPFMEQLSGLPAARVLGTYAPQLFARLRDQEVFNLAKRALAGEIVESGELRYRDPATGRDVWVSVTLNPYRSPQGETIGLIAFVSDITDRKLMEEELRLAHETKRDGPEDQTRRSDIYGLSPREQTILKLVAAGRSNKEVAGTLSISPATVSSHVSSILRKMKAASRAEAVARALRERLLS